MLLTVIASIAMTMTSATQENLRELRAGFLRLVGRSQARFEQLGFTFDNQLAATNVQKPNIRKPSAQKENL